MHWVFLTHDMALDPGKWTHTRTVPKWTREQTLYSAVPWLRDVADLRSFGPVETIVEHGREVTFGLLIPEPFGRDTTAMLQITTKDWRSGDVTLAITNALSFDYEPRRKRADLLSNPVRKAFPDQLDDNGAGDVDE